jgi:predicted nucleotidyltransferase
VFGSAVEGRLTADSDIDVAVVMQSPQLRGLGGPS